MPAQVLHLPDGQTFTVSPVFAGVGFKSHELTMHPNAFPIGWTTVLHTEEQVQDFDSGTFSRSYNISTDGSEAVAADHHGELGRAEDKDVADNAQYKTRIRRRPFVSPTLQDDTLFISSISNPANSDFKPAASPTRQIAMMVWITLYWYFHQPEPSSTVHTAFSSETPHGAKPTGDWKITIKRDGVLRGRNLIPKLERMGLLASEDTAVGTSLDDSGAGWDRLFVTKRMFWQIPGRLFLFTLAPNRALSSFPGSPAGSRPGSPVRGEATPSHAAHRHTHSQSPSLHASDLPGAPTPTTLTSTPSFPIGPFFSTSHLPTYYPPAPLQYKITGGVRHPLRPKPPRMGEMFYSRFVPSVGQYLSFRVASSSPKPVPYAGPVGPSPPDHQSLSNLTDDSLLRTWFANPRVKEFWGAYTPDFLTNALHSKHSFPAIGLWDGVPFGFFEIYWVKEDVLGQHLGHEAGNWDRGLHIMIGEEWSRGRVPLWLTSLIHWCLEADFRTMSVCLEPRVDNARILRHLDAHGFARERQVSFAHKQAWVVRLRRESWDGPAL